MDLMPTAPPPQVLTRHRSLPVTPEKAGRRRQRPNPETDGPWRAKGKRIILKDTGEIVGTAPSPDAARKIVRSMWCKYRQEEKARQKANRAG